MGRLWGGEEEVAGNLVELGLFGYSTQTTPAFLRWTPRTVPTPREYGTWTLVPTMWSSAPPPPFWGVCLGAGGA